jgi:NADH-quinone oxidoreductase subunit M
MLVLLVLVPLVAGFAAWPLARARPLWTRWISLGGCVLSFAISICLWLNAPGDVRISGGGAWLAEVRWSWIPQLGISMHLGVDGLSLLMVTLTGFLGVMAVLASWTSIHERTGFFHMNLMWVLAGITGVFLSLDLFLFYFFWELMLVPMYFLIDLWGHEHRHRAAVKFFVFTQFSGLLMLMSIVGLALVHRHVTGVFSFDYVDMLNLPIPRGAARWLMAGFLAAFFVKLPVVPFHTWLPDAHTEAPTAGSVILAGLLLKTGAYGLLRFVVPLFPVAAMQFAPIAMILGVAGILYGAAMAFAQTDLKRLVAYTSVSHLGFVLMGVFACNELALQGAVMQMICHGISTGALFILVGALQDRFGTRDVRSLGGLWTAVPAMGGAAMIFAMASLGLPGLGNFVGEFLVLLGSFRVSMPITSVAALGLVMATIYSVWIMYVTFFGRTAVTGKVADLRVHEACAMILMIAAIVWLGLFPQPVFDLGHAALKGIETLAAQGGVP